MIEYKPYRVLKHLCMEIERGDDTAALYPHGKIKKGLSPRGRRLIVYSPGIVNAPTEEEAALFDSIAFSKVVVPIPQDKRGFDERLSGVARSIETSIKGRETAIEETLKRRRIKKEKTKPINDATDIENEGDDFNE